MKITAKTTGLEDFEQAIRRLDSRKARSALQRALSQAATPVVKEAKRKADANVGRRTGEGRKSIKKRNLKKSERREFNADQAVMVYLHSDGFYLGIWEFGFTRDGRTYAAKPWFRPAVDSTRDEFTAKYRERAGEIVEREASKKR